MNPELAGYDRTEDPPKRDAYGEEVRLCPRRAYTASDARRVLAGPALRSAEHVHVPAVACHIFRRTAPRVRRGEGNREPGRASRRPEIG